MIMNNSWNYYGLSSTIWLFEQGSKSLAQWTGKNGLIWLKNCNRHLFKDKKITQAHRVSAVCSLWKIYRHAKLQDNSCC